MAPVASIKDPMFPVYPIFHAVLLSWILWKILKQIVAKHPLDDILGPPPQSYLWGPFYLDLICYAHLRIALRRQFQPDF